MKRTAVHFSFIAALAVYGLLLANAAGCSGGAGRGDSVSNSHFFTRTQEQLREVEPCVVGVGAMDDYRIELFHYELAANRFQKEKLSPTGYRLVRGREAITVLDTTLEVHGSGLILFHDEQRALVITARHLLTKPDTINTYYRDSTGAPTDVLYSLATRTKSIYYVNDQQGRRIKGEVLCIDERNDLGLIMVRTSQRIGMAFPYAIAFQKKLDWGDQVFVFGFPHQVKQLTSGLVSAAPYPGNFVIDAVTRSGYSGGPVLVVQPDGSLQFAGVLRAMASEEVRIVAPPVAALSGSYLVEEDIPRLRAEHFRLVEYGTTYGINAEKIGEFLLASKNVLARNGIYLAERTMPK